MQNEFFSPADDLNFALSLARTADKISLARFTAKDLRVETKPDRSYVTDADKAVEEALRDRITAERPHDGFFGEESGRNEKAQNSSGTRQWIIDPIDGTSNFLRGVPNWATLIALSVDEKPVLGVVSAPAFKKTWWASQGEGAWLKHDTAAPKRLRVSGVQKVSDASLSFQSIAQWRDAGFLEPLLRLSEQVWRDRAYGDMWSYMMLAEGLVDIVGEFDVKPYDLAALVPIVTEAGGRFTDITGAETAWNGSSLATNSLLHKDVLKIMNEKHSQI